MVVGSIARRGQSEKVNESVTDLDTDLSETYDARLSALGDWLATEPPMGDVAHAGRRLLLDTVACAIAGFRKVGLDRLSAAGGGYALLGADATLDPAEAAYAFALAACADEACEGLAFAHGRPGLHAVAGGIGAALRADADLDGLIDAVAAGFEFGGRMGGLFRARPGVHVDGTWGLVAATVAARRLYGGGGSALAAACQAALCQMPASLYLPVSQGADLRNSYSGHAAAAGMLVAASLATGMATPQGAVDAAAGFAFDRDDAAWLPPGRRLMLEGYLKPYPSVRHTHYGVEAAKLWRAARPDAAADAIQPVRLEIYPEAVVYCGNRAPTTPIMAQFSLSYTLAYSLIHGDLTPAAYEPAAFADPTLRALEARIEIAPVEALGAGGGRRARLAVGDGWRREVDGAPGDADAPLTDDQLAAKVRTFAAGRVDPDRTERLIDDLLGGPGDRPVRALLAP